MLKASSLVLFCIITFLHEVKMEMCPNSIAIEATSSKTDAQTAEIEPGTTKTLLVKCSMNAETSNDSDVKRITLLYSRNQIKYEPFAYINDIGMVP